MSAERYASIPADWPANDLEEKLLERWREERLFERTLEARKDGVPFIFYDGPPTANGLPGIHHVFARTVKDLFCRHRAMRGHHVPRKAGWDTHGLPVEIEVEKALGLSGKPDIERFGVVEFNQRCRESVWKYRAEWERLVERVAHWMDYEHPYVTYTNDYIESEWWALKTLFDNARLYRGHKILPYCARCGTTLSSHEVAQGYEDVEDPSVYVALELQGSGKGEEGRGDSAAISGLPARRLLVWTTTPWTLVSNVALAVHPDLEYVELRKRTGAEWTIILAEARAGAVLGGDFTDRWEVVARLTGRDLVGKRYRRPLDWVPYGEGTGAHEVIVGADFVSADDGSGIVHMAPAFGADDYAMGRQHGLVMLQPVNLRGEFDAGIPVVGGKWVKTADPLIIEELKKSGVLWKVETVTHAYPHCWRCRTPLLYYARDSWFVRTTAFKDEMLARNARMDWHPAEVGVGRFGEWLKNNVDWAISRSRYWGTPLPIWVCDRDATHVEAVGSFAELAARTGRPIPDDFDAHKPFVDAWTWECFNCGGRGKGEGESDNGGGRGKGEEGSDNGGGRGKGEEGSDNGAGRGKGEEGSEPAARDSSTSSASLVSQASPASGASAASESPAAGGTMRRVPEVIDAWFDSGSMPFAQWHYPFENHEKTAAQYPADFIAEGLDQTRGWFYSLLAIATGLGDALPNNGGRGKGEGGSESAGDDSPRDPREQPTGRDTADADHTARLARSYETAPYRAVVVNDLVLDANGVKMAKSRGNVVNPFQVIERHGADAVRLFLIASSQLGIPKRFDENMIRETASGFLLTLRNVYSGIFAQYANFGWTTSDRDPPAAERPLLDRWILSRLTTVEREADRLLGEYDATAAARLIMTFVVDDVSNWYVRQSRSRFWEVDGDDNRAAFATLHEVLVVTCRLLAPLAPYVSDWIHRQLTGTSVHLADYTRAVPMPVDPSLERAMEEIRALSRLGRAAREEAGINVRRPLGRVACVVPPDRVEGARQLLPLLRSELNVKEATLLTTADELVTLEAKPNFRALGKKFGKATPLAAQAVQALTSDHLRAFERGAPIAVSVEGESHLLDADDVTILRRAVGELVVKEADGRFAAIDTIVTPELRREGFARELVSRIQRMRKEAGLAVADRIRLSIAGAGEIEAAAEEYKDWISRETLARVITIGRSGAEAEPAAHAVEIDGLVVNVALTMDQ